MTGFQDMGRGLAHFACSLAIPAVILSSLAGCAGTTIIVTSPPDATVRVDGAPVEGNSFEYGRWIGNQYTLAASAPGYREEEVVADVHLGQRAGIIAFYSLISIIGAPVIVAIPWFGEIDSQIFISLEREGS